ncbi:hypothetical protein MSC49_40520 (plasmid) [Methylosinus sp. C49]|nr:hypothetical protein MSC49_40520 [Methylosinus sp. C49]
MRKLGISRRDLFEKIERDALGPLPATEWEFAEWKRARVNIDYHIDAESFFYSVPHALIHAEVDVRVTERMIEVFHRGQRVGLHERRYMGARHGTAPEHMPSVHRRYAAWTPDRFRRWAATIGPHTEGLIAAMLAARRHPEQGFRTCLGVLKLYRGVEAAKAEAVSARALEIGAFNCKSVAALLTGKSRASGAGDALRQRCSITKISAVPAITTERNPSMLAHPTLDLSNALGPGLYGLAKWFKELEHKAEARGLEHAEWLGLLLEYELTLRRQKRFETRSRAARLRHPASVEDVDYQSTRGLDRALFLKLAACDWIAERRNLLITGASGLGKSWLACALGQKACRQDISVLYYRVPRLFTDLTVAHGDGSYGRLLRKIARARLLILDDWGPEALVGDQARDLLEIVEDRYDAGSLVITSQVPVDRWHEMIGILTIADAILDRVIHNAYRLELSGDSLRKRRSAPWPHRAAQRRRPHRGRLAERRAALAGRAAPAERRADHPRQIAGGACRPRPLRDALLISSARGDAGGRGRARPLGHREPAALGSRRRLRRGPIAPRKGHCARNMAIVRHFAVNMIRTAQSLRTSP